MIYGIGNDIIEIERIKKALLREGFIKKLCTEKEIENLQRRGNREESYAGIFSAKEAIAKAIGIGVRTYSLTDMEILNDDLGKPYALISEKLDKIIKERFGIYNIELSISHSKEYATAVAIIFKA
ncbi:holo-ACP synthase [Fusobacterium russii]|uniref:holo-ACP synthase n=1 Tax=Fusobacterium russii TaxID=854 RepID=UPI0003A8D969|nr:holo-ACP synthase [Fusobacterium russii]